MFFLCLWTDYRDYGLQYIYAYNPVSKAGLDSYAENVNVFVCFVYVFDDLFIYVL